MHAPAAQPVAAPPTRAKEGDAPLARFANLREFIDALGGIPLERVVLHPLPGTATEADLLQLAERDKRLCELIEGTLVEKPVGFNEGEIGINIGAAVHAFVRKHKLGSVAGADATLRMSSVNRIRMPDVCFIAKARLPKGKLPAVPAIGPDLAVEVLSESNTKAEMRQKLAEYFDNGTRLAWLVDPATRTVAIYTKPDAADRELGEADALDGGDVLPGFSLAIAEVFATSDDE